MGLALAVSTTQEVSGPFTVKEPIVSGLEKAGLVEYSTTGNMLPLPAGALLVVAKLSESTFSREPGATVTVKY